MSARQRPFEEFAREWLPAPPARVLEVGCGAGELAISLHAAGYELLAIDPAAPEGAIFRRLELADLDPSELAFDAVVAGNVLHHVADLDDALDRVVALLVPGGRLLVEEFSWDLLDEPTADWLHGQRRALAAAGRGDAPPPLDQLRADWAAERVGLHGFEAVRDALARSVDELAFEWTPHLYRLLGGYSSEALESALIEAGAIRALGWRFAGERRG